MVEGGDPVLWSLRIAGQNGQEMGQGGGCGTEREEK